MSAKPKIALFLGGTSPEREVSKSSAASIYKTLTGLGYETILIDPAYGKNQPDKPEDFFSKEDYSVLSTKNYLDACSLPQLNNIDLVFLALHGKYGEDGTIQSLLELKGLKYTGSKVLSSALSMDKTMSKVLFKEYNVNTPKGFTISDKNLSPKIIAEKINDELSYPCVIKPNDQGSTVGLTVCKNDNDVEAAMKHAFIFSDKVLIEEFIAGREMTVAVIEDKAFPVLEIKPKHGLYDYECKYTSGMSEYEVPAKIPDDVAAELQSQALLAFKALDCSSYARVDFRLSENNKPYCLEVNSLPGMTATSLVPKMAKAVGISFDQLIERIIQISL